jgi:hypothetical protein
MIEQPAKTHRAMSEKKKATSRRDFVRKATLGSAAAAFLPKSVAAALADRKKILAALGDTIIPSKPGDPGFRDMEPHGIIEEIDKTLGAFKDGDFEALNQASAPLFGGRTFVELSKAERSDFVSLLVAGDQFPDKGSRTALQRLYRLVRISVLRIFYSNFPESGIPRDADGIPVLPPGDLHQITVPNTKNLVTAWDLVGYRGPLTWEQEQEMRSRVQEVHWHDSMEDLIVRYRPRKRIESPGD